MSVTLPEKHFYTIGDVSRLTATKPHILRYWESQFKLLRPARRYSGHRKYTARDIELIQKIRHLILEKKYTLAGAKREMNRQFSPKNSNPDGTSKEMPRFPLLQEIKKDIDSCLELLDSNSAPKQIELV